MERTGVVYIATINDRSYVGQTLDFPRRKTEHLYAYGDTAISNAIRKHGADAVEWRILEADIPEKRLPDREVLWIGFYDTYHNGLNMTEGGDNNPMLNPENRRKASEVHQANVASGQHQAQQPEFKKKLSDTMLAKSARGECPMQNPVSLKRKLMSEAKNKITNLQKAGQLFILEIDLESD